MDPIIETRIGVLKVARCPSLRFIVAPAAGTRQRLFPAPNWHLAALARRPGAGRGIPVPGATVRYYKFQVGRDSLAGLGHALIGFEIDLLILEAAPEPFDKDVVAEPPATVHADGNSVVTQHAGEVLVGELATLVGVEDIGVPLAQRFRQGRDAKAGVEQVRQSPSEDVAAHPVHDGDQVEKAVRHWDVRYIGGPHLVNPRDRQPAQQIRVNPMFGRRPAGPRALVDSRQAHSLHQVLHPFAIDHVALRL